MILNNADEPDFEKIDMTEEEFSQYILDEIIKKQDRQAAEINYIIVSELAQHITECSITSTDNGNANLLTGK